MMPLHPAQAQASAPGLDAMEIAAQLKEVHKVYRIGDQQVNALAGVSVEFKVGQFWAILGSSGSGKSTLLNLLGCLDRPTSGRYHLSGLDVANMPDNELSELRLRRLGFIFQSFNLIPQHSVEANIQLPLDYLGRDPEESRQRARELAQRVGLGQRLNHRPIGTEERPNQSRVQSD